MIFIGIVMGCNLVSEPNNMSKNSTEVHFESIGSRTVLPLYEVTEYKLYGNKKGEEETLLGTSSNMEGLKQNLENGIWDFRLEGYLSNGDLLNDALVTDITLDNTPLTISFTIEPQPSGNGNIEITLLWPESIGTINSISYILKSFSDSSEITRGVDAAINNSYTYKYNDIPKGDYFITFNLDDRCYVSELIKVYPKMNSKKSISLTTDSFNKAPVSPSNFTATVVPVNENPDDNVKVKFTWDDNSNNETGFRLYFKTPIDTIDYMDLTAGTTEFTTSTFSKADQEFYLTAENSFGESEGSNKVQLNVPCLVKIEYLGGIDSNGNTSIKEHKELGTTFTFPVAPVKKQDGITLRLTDWILNQSGPATGNKAPGSTITIDSSLNYCANWSNDVIGATGPGGGIVFYDDGSVNSDGWRYLEVLDRDTQSRSWEESIQFAESFSSNNYTDWHLPTENQLDILITTKNITHSKYYWTQDEKNNGEALSIYVSNRFEGVKLSMPKSNPFKSVIIRAFRSERETYRVYYDPNGAGGKVADNYYYENGESFKLKDSASLARNVYQKGFIGWKTQDGRIYNTGDRATIKGKDITLTAQWEEYTPGDTGPAGGIIIFDNETIHDDGWRYIEMAPREGDGDVSNWDGAIAYCDNFTLNGYSDWSLPNKDEIIHFKSSYNSYGSGKYWSSTTVEEDPTKAYFIWNPGENTRVLSKHMGHPDAKPVRKF